MAIILPLSGQNNFITIPFLLKADYFLIQYIPITVSLPLPPHLRSYADPLPLYLSLEKSMLLRDKNKALQHEILIKQKPSHRNLTRQGNRRKNNYGFTELMLCFKRNLKLGKSTLVSLNVVGMLFVFWIIGTVENTMQD